MALLEARENGLYCPEGGFWIDPAAPVERAVITHAHGDHVSAGCGAYLNCQPGEELITGRFPELEALGALLPEGTAIDGEVLPWKDGAPRCSPTTPSASGTRESWYPSPKPIPGRATRKSAKWTGSCAATRWRRSARSTR